MSVRPQSGLTESTSSSRSRAASGRPSGWPTLHARSASASCSAAWSNRASGSPRPARSRACAITSISTATSSLPTTRGKGSSSWTVSNFHPSSRVWVSEKRYLVLAEGKALDPHYGKTARGVILYGPHPVSALVDSENTGADVEGIPVVASVEDGLAVEPRANTALVGVALAGGRLPAEWRVLLRAVLEAGLDLESGMHELLSEDRELADLARRHGAEIRDLRKPPADLSVSSGANLLQDATVVLTVGSDCAIGKKSVAIELDREARGRRRRGGLPRRRGRAARGRGRKTRRPPLRRRTGIDRAPAVLRSRARALPRQRPASPRSLPHGRRDGDRRVPGPPDSPAARARRPP